MEESGLKVGNYSITVVDTGERLKVKVMPSEEKFS